MGDEKSCWCARCTEARGAEYIGDGVYATADTDARTVTLTTDGGDRTETIVLGAAMLAELVALAKRHGVTT